MVSASHSPMSSINLFRFLRFPAHSTTNYICYMYALCGMRYRQILLAKDIKWHLLLHSPLVTTHKLMINALWDARHLLCDYMSSLRRHISFDDQVLSDEDIYSDEDNHFDDDNHSDDTHSVDTHSNDNNPPPTPISNPLPSESDVPGFNIIRRNGCKIYPTGVKPFKNGLAIHIRSKWPSCVKKWFQGFLGA
eukprot:403027_1